MTGDRVIRAKDGRPTPTHPLGGGANHGGMRRVKVGVAPRPTDNGDMRQREKRGGAPGGPLAGGREARPKGLFGGARRAGGREPRRSPGGFGGLPPPEAGLRWRGSPLNVERCGVGCSLFWRWHRKRSAVGT